MTVRVHGAVGTSRLGYFQGENALLSIVVKNAAVDFDETGVLMTLVDFKKMYARDITKDIAEDVTYDEDGHHAGILMVTVPNCSVEQRTFKGVVITSDAEYLAAYAKQHNLRQLIDSVQQRAVIIGTSKGGRVASGVVSVAAGYDKALTVDVADTSAVSMLVERADVMDKYPINTFGQLTGSAQVGQHLIDSVAGLKFLAADGVTAAILGTTEFAVKIARQIPQVV